MKIEKVKSKLKKAFNRVMGVLLPVSTLLVSCDTNALVVHAADTSQIIVFYIKEIGEDYERSVKGTIEVPEDYEVVGRLYKVNTGDSLTERYTITLYALKNGEIDTEFFNDKSIVQIGKNKYGSYNETLTGSQYYGAFSYSGGNGSLLSSSFELLEGSMKVFKTSEEFKSYVSTGTGEYDIIKPDTIDDGVKDPDIGYLHNLQMNQLQSGKQDENGIYERYSDRFTWDDTYPEYDSSYLIEVRGKCVVQTKGFLGLGKVKTYTSDIENIAKDISYNDLEWIVSSTDKYAPFNSFINEHMPTNLVMTGVYGMRDLYFRIYKWSEVDDCYHYGPWVNMHFVDDDVWVSVDGDTTMGDFDEDGNFIIDPDSDYGTGKKNDVGVGVGDTEDDAKKDNDRRNEEKKNDDGKLDLSNSSLTDIWNWFTTSLWNLYNSLGFIPEFFQKIFSFLPTPIYVFLGIGIVIAIVLRVLGR